MQLIPKSVLLLVLAFIFDTDALQALPSGAEVKRRLLKTQSSAAQSLQLDIIGDSISAGALAGTRLGRPPSPEFVSGILAAIVARDPQLFLAATLNPQSAYPEGLGLLLLERYKLPSSKLTLHNESAVGRSMSNVTEKVLQSLATPKDRLVEHHILVMLGSNDFCQGKSPERFLESSMEVFRLLDRMYPNAKILVAEIPPIYQLRNFRQEIIFGQLSCEAVQRLYCDRLYAPEAESVIHAYNKGLKKLISEANKKQAGARYKSVDLPSDLTIDKDLLSLDCFHPSEEGHKKLAASIASQWVTGG